MDENKRNTALNIFERMRLATDSIATVAKNLNVAGKYNAVAEGDVLEAVKEAESVFGIYSYPEERELLLQDVVELTERKIPHMLVRISTKYRFVNIDKPEESIVVGTYGTGIDSGDKDVGKAMTYADKYALLKAYKIETGADPDKDLSPQGGYNKSSATPLAKAKPIPPVSNSKPSVKEEKPAQEVEAPIVDFAKERYDKIAECQKIYNEVFDGEQQNLMNAWLMQKFGTAILPQLSIEQLRDAHRAYVLTRDKINIAAEKKRKEDKPEKIVPSDDIPF